MVRKLEEKSKFNRYKILSDSIDKKKVKKMQKFIGDASSINFLKKIEIGIIFGVFFGIGLYVIGIGMPESFQSAGSSNFRYISMRVVNMVIFIGKYTNPVMKFALGVLFIGTMVNIIFPRNMPKQLLFGTIYITWVGICVLIAGIPLFFGLTWGMFGITGFITQAVVAIFLLFTKTGTIISRVKAELYQEKPKRYDKYSFLVVFIFVVLTLLNKYVFKIGISTNQTDKFGLIYGWGLLYWALFAILFFRIVYKQLCYSWLLVKYEDQFYKDLNFSDKEWYGKRKAKKMKCEKEKEK